MTVGCCGTRAVRTLAAIAVVGILFNQHGAAQSATFQRGEQVRVKFPTKPSEPKQTGMVVTVVAVPQDRIRIDKSAVYVNDVPVSNFSQEFLERIAHSKQTPKIVPDGQYFVMGEIRTALDDIVESWGVHPADDLESATR